METINRIQQNVAKMNLSPAEWFEVSRLVGQAFRAGLADQPDPLAGYSNLTAAIKAGEPIDWEELDGLKVKCMNPEVGTLSGKLERNKILPADYPAGWWHKGADSLYVSAFIYGWTGHYGWTLWTEGEIPLRRKTADQLEVGTYFTGRMGAGGGRRLYVGKNVWEDRKAIFYAPNMLESPILPSKWVVIEEHGPFQKPEGK